MKKIIFSSLLIFIFVLLFYKIVNVNYEDTIPVNTNSIGVLKNHSYGIMLDSLKKKDELSTNQQANQEYISKVWTIDLEKKIESKFTTYNPDSIILLLQWSEKFKTYGEVDQSHAILCNVIYIHWLNYTVNKMNAFYQQNTGIKYDYKFKYIVSRCAEQQFNIAIGNSHFEKVIENITKANFSYLLNRFWGGASILIKLIVFGFMLSFVFILFVCIKTVLKKKKIMKINKITIGLAGLLGLSVLTAAKFNPFTYDSDLVNVSNVTYKGEQYTTVYMQRKGNRVKAKYFAAKDVNGETVPNRYKKWSASKNVVLYSSGTYMDKMDNTGNPIGLTIDNGVMVNRSLINNRLDGLVIVYATGGIAISNLKDGDLTLSGGGVDVNKKFNLRNSSWDLQTFIDWAQSQEATVFQTHLLVYKNQLTTFSNGGADKRERRFLAVGKDDDGNVVHIIVQHPSPCSIYNGAKDVLAFLNEFKEIQVTFMINLDTGAQDVFKLYNKDGSENATVKGKLTLNDAVNLLTYYYE